MYSLPDFVYTNLYLLAFKKHWERLNEGTEGIQRSGDSIHSALKDNGGIEASLGPVGFEVPWGPLAGAVQHSCTHGFRLSSELGRECWDLALNQLLL